MGLFSFLKNAGAKLWSKKDKPAETVAATPEKSREDLLKEEVTKLGIPVNNLDIELCEQIIVKGRTATNADREKVILALGNVEGIGCVEDHIDVDNPEPETVFLYRKKRRFVIAHRQSALWRSDEISRYF